MLFVIYFVVFVYLCIPLIPGVDKMYNESDEDKNKRIIVVSVLGGIAAILFVLEFIMKIKMYNESADMVATFALTVLAVYLNSKFSIYEIVSFVLLMTVYMLYNQTSYLQDFKQKLPKRPTIPSIKSVIFPKKKVESMATNEIQTELTSSLPNQV